MPRLCKKITALILTLLCVCFLASCGGLSDRESKSLSVVTTVFPIYDFARAVGGEKAEIKMLIDAGCEVHSFDPKPSDLAAIERSDLFLYTGGESDEWVDGLLGDRDISSYALKDCVKLLKEDGEDEMDEHIWTSDENAVLMCNKICDLFCKKDAKNREYYKENCRSYTDKIKAARKEIAAAADTLSDRFILVADRFPFKYFANEYNLNYVAAFGGCATGNDVSIKTMRMLFDTVKAKKPDCIFRTEMSNSVIADALSEQTGLQILELHSAHNVTLDDFKSGVTYVDLMYRNAKVLRKAGGKSE